MKSGTMVLKLTAALVVVAAASSVHAQGQGGGRGRGFGFGFGRGGAVDPSILLAQEPVQKELELSEDQKSQVTKFADENLQSMMQTMRDMRSNGASPEEMQAKMQERTKENKKKIAEILLPPQVTRLDEISLQVAGAGALSQPEVAQKLGITDDQKQKLEGLSADSRDKMMEIFSGGPPADDQERQDRQAKMQKITSEQKEKSLALLTSEQRDQFEKMQGKKFDTSTIQFGGRGFGRGGGRGPGGA